MKMLCFCGFVNRMPTVERADRFGLRSSGRRRACGSAPGRNPLEAASFCLHPLDAGCDICGHQRTFLVTATLASGRLGYKCVRLIHIELLPE